MTQEKQNIKYLNTDFSPDKLKDLKIKELISLCGEIREQIIDATYKNGGHLASNLGVVELTVALHYILKTPADKLIFDVGHQCYAHKLITGRSLETLRRRHGISGFTSPKESEYDTVWAGHSSTSLSSALGLCRARDITGGSHNVVAMIGDASLSSGMAFEALNDIGNYSGKLVVVLNDNEMSIEKNVGALSTHLSRIRLNPNYRGIKKRFAYFLLAIPLIGKPLKRLMEKIKNLFSLLIIRRNIFDDFGIKYAGPYDGHSLPELIKALKNAVRADRPVLLHVITKKGKGYPDSENNPVCFHGVKQGFGGRAPEFSKSIGQYLTLLAKDNPKITAVTAAMSEGTGLRPFAEAFPKNYFDVGICEQHAVTLCAGMATGGLKPYFAVYSTFLQRAIDQVSNDICIPNLPVTLLIDRAGISGSDGETHQGVLDISFLSALPNMTIYAPADLNQLRLALKFSQSFMSPLAIRYGNSYSGELCDLAGKADIEIKEYGNTDLDLNSFYAWQRLTAVCGQNINIITYGNALLSIAFLAAGELKQKGIHVGIINAACIKPLDTGLLSGLSGVCVVMEEVMPHGSLFSAVSSYLTNNPNKQDTLELKKLCLPEEYIPHGTQQQLFSDYGVSVSKLCELLQSSTNTNTNTNTDSGL